jgi:hypothetical protein
MKELQDQLEELSEEDLGKCLCERCIAVGLSIKDSLYDERKMEISSFTGDLICPHCSIVEDEQGHEKMSPELIEYIGIIVEEYKNWKSNQ